MTAPDTPRKLSYQEEIRYDLMKQIAKLESEIAALKQQGEKVVCDEKECYNCKDKVKMVSRGEFCPNCMCDQ